MSAPSGEYLIVNGLNMYYETYGSGEPLLLIHGGTVNARKMWEKQLPTLSKDFKVIAPDSRGHGRTDNPSGQISYRLMADDMAALLGKLDLGRPLVCGYSDGGQIALEIGMRYPELPKALVVGAATNQISENFLKSIRQIGVEGPGKINFDQVEKAAPGLVNRLRESHSQNHDPEYWKKYLTQMSVVWMTPLGYTSEDYQKITVPTLILLGDRDDSIPIEEALEMYRLIPKAEIAILPASTHYLVWDRPELFANLALDFLKRQAGIK